MASVCAAARSGRGDGLELHVQSRAGTLANDLAVPLALILNELIANAAEHGAGPDGAGSVGMCLVEEEGGFTLIVEDEGPGFELNEVRRRSSGLGLVIGMEVEAGLKDAGYTVARPAATAEEAVELAGSRRPALAVMDIRLASERDGIDAVIEIFETLGIRSLFASAHADSQVRARAESARPLGWVPKPYRVETLLAAIREALNEV